MAENFKDQLDKDIEKVEEGIITNESSFRTAIEGAKKCTVKFIKANGSVRIMNFTLDFNSIPKQHHPKGKGKKGGAIAVFDIDKAGWRSVPYDRTQWVRVHTLPNKPDILYTIKH